MMKNVYSVEVLVYSAGWERVARFVVENDPIKDGSAKRLAKDIAKSLRQCYKEPVRIFAGGAKDLSSYAVQRASGLYPDTWDTLVRIDVVWVEMKDRIPDDLSETVMKSYGEHYL